MDINYFISEVTTALKQKTLSIFCGAGISFNSGLPIVDQLLNYLYKTLELDDTAKYKLFESEIPFERVMETLLIESEIYEIQNIFLEGTPNNNHKFIAKLSKLQLLKIIYTTNFDLLIEKALESEGLVNGEHFRVYKTEQELRNINWKDSLIKIIKIHGCASERKEMAIILSQLASDRYLDLRQNLLSQIFSTKESSSVLVLGYSCSDFDLVPIIGALEDPSSDIFFVEHSSEKSKAEPIHIKEQKNPFKNYAGIRMNESTDKIVNLLSDTLNLKISNATTIEETSWKKDIDTWYLNNIENSGPGFKHHVNAKLLYSIGDNHGTIEHASQSIEIAYRHNNTNAYASELGTMGLAYNRLGKYEEALGCFQKSLPILRQIGDDENIAAQTQSYANILHHIGKNEEAIIYFKEALNIAQRNNNKFTESNISGNITNCYISLNQLVFARYYVDIALELSQNLGNKQAESSQLGMLSRIYFEMGQFQKALAIMLDAIQIKKMIADNNELCKLYLNLTNIYNMLGELDSAKKSANECLELARYLDNALLEQMVMITIKNLNQIPQSDITNRSILKS